MKMIKRIDSRTAIRRMCFKAIWPTAPRDFIVCTTWKELENGSVVICTMSVSNDIYPPKEGYVRGNVIISGYYIRPNQDQNPVTMESTGNLDVTLCLHTDLGGTLPAGIINLLATSAPIKMLTTIDQISRQESLRQNIVQVN